MKQSSVHLDNNRKVPGTTTEKITDIDFVVTKWPIKVSVEPPALFVATRLIDVKHDRSLITTIYHDYILVEIQLTTGHRHECETQ